MIEKFNTLIIGGALANTFLFAQGYNMGKSFVEKYLIKDAIDILRSSNSIMVSSIATFVMYQGYEIIFVV